MAPNPRRLDARLQAIYDRIPKLECRGLCYDSCGPIEASVRERQRIERAGGRTLCTVDGSCCSMLGPDNRCTVYDVRPLICRLYGVAKGLECPYGCKPERYLTRVEASEMLAEAEREGGTMPGRQSRLETELRTYLEREGREALERELRKTQGQPITLAGRDGGLRNIGRQSIFDG